MILWELFRTFFKIGAFTFGGGYAMLPLIQAEVEAHGWMTTAELVNFIAVSESTPGPFAVNIATYVGTETAGLAGAALIATHIDLGLEAAVLEVRLIHRLEPGIAGGGADRVLDDLGGEVRLGRFDCADAASELAVLLQADERPGPHLEFGRHRQGNARHSAEADILLDGLPGETHQRIALSSFDHTTPP